METGGRRAARREAKREEVLEAAIGLVREDGLGGLTAVRLATALGCAPGAIYRYFDGLPGVLVALQEQAITQLAREIGEATAASRAAEAKRPSRDPRRAALRHLLVALRPVVDGATREPTRHRLIDELLSRPEEVLATEQLRAVNAVLAPLLEQVAGLFEEAVTAGALTAGDADVRTRLVWAATHGLDHFRKRDRGEPTRLRVDRLRPELLRTLLVGWGAPVELLKGLL